MDSKLNGFTVTICINYKALGSDQATENSQAPDIIQRNTWPQYALKQCNYWRFMWLGSIYFRSLNDSIHGMLRLLVQGVSLFVCGTYHNSSFIHKVSVVAIF